MDERIKRRLSHVVDAVHQISLLLADKTLADIAADRPLKAAFERFLEIASEASRHVPDDLKQQQPHVPWRHIADIGNVIRHAYQRVDDEIIWQIYAGGQLEDLRDACEALLAGGNR